MKEFWNLSGSLVEKENIDIATKWILIVLGITGLITAAVVYVYPTGNPDFFILVLFAISLISKALGRGEFLQMPWRTYLWFYGTVFTFIPLYAVYKIEDFSADFLTTDFAFMLLGLIGIVGIYGFVYKKKFLNQKFWQIVFIIDIAIIAWDYAIKLINAESFQPMAIGWGYLIFTLLVPFYYALGMYAFKLSAIWSDSTNSHPNIKKDYSPSKTTRIPSKNGILTFIFVGLSLLIVYFFQGENVSFFSLIALLFCGGMAMMYLSKYARELYGE